MKKERLLALLLFGYLIIPVLVSAESCSSSEQTILTLYSTRNSHAAVFNGTYNDPAADVPICYDNIFGRTYSGSKPWDCNGANGVVDLATKRNSHVGNTSSSYPISVCYGDLKCTVRSACLPPEKEVLALSGTRNAHASVNSTFSPMYTSRVCCALGDMVYWADVSGARITRSYVNRTVMLVAQTTFNVGTTVTFEISEDNCLPNNLCTATTIPTTPPLRGVTNGQGVATALWNISDEAIKLGSSDEGSGDDDRAIEDELEFYFTATAQGFSKTSKNLTVNKSEGPSRIQARICSPEHKQIYFAETNLTFKDCSLSDEGIVSFEWYIYDGAKTEVILNQREFNKTFEATETGQKTITLKVRDISGQRSEVQVAILVIGIQNDILGFVNDPFHQEVIDVSGQVLKADFSASDSYVINNSVGVPTPTPCSGQGIHCLSGDCPRETMSPRPLPGCLENISVSVGTRNFNKVNFIWTFENSIGLEEPYSFDGFGNVSGTKYYTIPSLRMNDKIIKLTAKYNENSINLLTSNIREFTLLDRCLPGQGIYVYTDPSGHITETRDLDLGGCVGGDGNTGTYDDCCPSRSICKADAQTGIAGCAPNASAPISCGGYKNKIDCEKDDFKIRYYLNNPERSEDPACGTMKNGSLTVCSGCIWTTPQVGGNAKCLLNKTFAPQPGIRWPEACSPEACLTSTSADGLQQCGEDGFLSLLVNKYFVDGNCGAISQLDCIDSTARVVCRANLLDFPFFGITQFFVSLAAVIIFSVLILERKKSSSF